MILTERDKLIIREIVRFKCMLGRQIKYLSGFTGTRATDRRLKILIENGYIERRHYIYGIPSIYSITSKAKRELEITMSINQPRLDQIQHDINVVDTAIYYMIKDNIKREEITTEKQLRNIAGFGIRGHLPDLVLNTQDKQHCIEVELNQKSKDRLEQNIKSNYLKCDSQIWIVPKDKPKIRQLLTEASIKYPNIEILGLENIQQQIKQLQ